MFATLRSVWKKSARRRPSRPQSAGRRLGLESLEDRVTPSGGPGPSGGSTSLSGSPGGPSTQQVAVLDNSGGPGPSGGAGSNIGSGSTGGSNSGGGPGYPLPPSTGPVRPDPGTVVTSTTTITLVPVTGTPGGPDPSLALVPVTTGGGTSTC